MARASAADLAHGIKGASFPISTKQLAEHARQNRAPDEVVQTIREMPDQEFRSITEVEHAFSQSHRRAPSGAGSGAAQRGGSHRMRN
jgi:Protein of unknown function (DUF2795)